MNAFILPLTNKLALGSRFSCYQTSSRPCCDVKDRTSKLGIYAMTSESNDADEWQKAFDSGADLRNRLQKLSDEREAQAQRTEQRLNDMAARLESIVQKVRQNAGMPPVASPPKPASKTIPMEGAQLTKPVAPSESDDISTSDEPYMDPSNFGIDSAAGWQVLASENQLPEIDESGVKFRIECDENGCSVIEIVGDGSPPGPGVRSQFLQSGPGFRVGYDPEGPKSFCATVGNENWLLALSRDEIRHFKRLTLALEKKMDRIARGLDVPPEKKPTVRRSGDGMFNERVARTGSDCSVELESKLLWVQAFGKPDPGQYNIRAIFMEGGRQCEGSWIRQQVPGLLAAVGCLSID